MIRMAIACAFAFLFTGTTIVMPGGLEARAQACPNGQCPPPTQPQ